MSKSESATNAATNATAPATAAAPATATATATAAATGDWREGRRQSARAAIVEAAWSLVREQGLAGLSMRDLARRAGITTPTVYAYFDSKNDIYDAMFGQAAADFYAFIDAPYDEEGDPRALLIAAVRRFVEFCTSDVARYQLVFQRHIPGFEPSASSYLPAVQALESTRGRLHRSGVTDPRHLDLWTALNTGLVAQQIANDPGGERWTRLIEDAVDMYLAHCLARPAPPGPTQHQPTKHPSKKRSKR